MGVSARSASATLPERADARVDPAARARGRVLVVDDDDAVRAWLDDALRDEGYAVAQARDTVTALILLLVEGADVVILDWKMPELDGFELLGSVRRCFPNLPVIFVTAYPRPDVYYRAMQHGAFGFLAKPFPLEDLLLEVNGALHPLATQRKSATGDAEKAGPR